MRQSVLPLLLLVGAALAAGCSDAGPPPGKADVDADVAPPPTMVEGTLTACVAPTPAVAESVDGDWEGFDVAVLEEVAERLRLGLEVVAETFDEVVSGVALNGGACDVAAAAVVAADALDAVVVTSVPYRTVHRLVVTTSDARQVQPEQVSGRVGVEEAGPAADAVSALSQAEVVAYPSQTDLARALVGGTVDAVLVAARARPELAAAVDTELSLLATVPTDAQTVLLLPMTVDDELREAIDGALAALQETGELDALRDAWLRN